MIVSKPSRRHFHHSRSSKKGQTLVEYGLVLAIVSVVAIATMLNVTGEVKTVYTGTIVAQLNQAQIGGATAQTRNP